MTELKPCPFCGGAGKYHGSYDEDDVCEYVSCTRCNASTPLMDKKSESIKWWNRRASPWHTGTPSEEGWYLIKYKHNSGIRYIAMGNPSIWVFTADTTIAWQKIEPYKEKEDGKK